MLRCLMGWELLDEWFRGADVLVEVANRWRWVAQSSVALMTAEWQQTEREL